MAKVAKIQDYVDDFNDLVVDLENLGENFNDELKTVQFILVSCRYLSGMLLHSNKKTVTNHTIIIDLSTYDMQ